MRLLNPRSSVNYPRGVARWLGETSRSVLAELAHFRERANLCLQSLIVLPLDLKFCLELLYE